jgi:putative ABC transport system permease protein
MPIYAPLIRQIFYEMWLHKLRSSLAIFCIAFGTLTVVMLLALGTGFHEASRRNMDIAEGSFAVWLGRSEKSYDGYPKGRFNHMTMADILELQKISPNIEAISPQRFKSAILSYAGKAYNKRVVGVAPDYISLHKIKLTAGSRFINKIDVENQARVAVISNKIKEMLFGKGDALGLRFLINNVPFTVIGVLPKENKHHSNDEVFISNQSYEALYGDKYIDYILILPRPDTDPIQFEQLLRGYFARKCHFDKNDKGVLQLWGSNKIFQFIRWFFIGVQLFLGACGVMVLAVGSIGVANIMFLIVTERTYEIGLRKAIGATDRQILLQFLFEALIIVGIGGCLGISIALAAITILQHVVLPSWIGTPVLSWITVSVTIFVLALIGLLAGFFPAHRAARIDPIEALMA